MTRRNLIILAACVVGIAGLIGLGLRSGAFDPPKPPGPGGDFVLVDQTGKTVSQDILKGKWSAVFFGFTYCPDVCPTTLGILGQTQTQLGPKAKDFQVIFISVDPERDTPEALKAYLDNESFPKGTIGLTGSKEQIAAAAKAYRVFYQKSGEGSDYLVNHSTATYLMNPEGRFAKVLPFGIAPDEIALQISGAMR
ncbi:MAG: photosynthetic protein synthase I [Alphaproteobacteria bacterium PA2]|nr:MAG: photosynthetic protein synthase I [Alphaproteobacteria bacterium PA2]